MNSFVCKQTFEKASDSEIAEKGLNFVCTYDKDDQKLHCIKRTTADNIDYFSDDKVLRFKCEYIGMDTDHITLQFD